MSDNDDQEWKRWAEDYRGGGGHEDAALLRRAEKRVRRETVKQWAGTALEIAASVFLVVFYLRLIPREPHPWLLVEAGASFAFVVAWLGYWFHVRRGTWMAPSHSTRDYLALTVKRRRAELQFYRFARWTCVFFALFVAAWAPFVLAAKWAIYAREPWRGIVGFGGAYAILGALYVLYGRKVERAGRELASLAKAGEAVPGEDPAGGGLT